MIKKVFSLFYTCLGWTYVAFIFIAHFCFFSVYRVFSQDPEWDAMRSAVPFLKSAFFIGRISLNIKGQEHIPKEGNFILVANHQSFVDIPLFLCAIPRKFSFLAKKELLNVPILGWDLKAQGHIPVNRENPKTSVRELQRLEGELKNGRSLLFFPEGTRTLTGEIGAFKKGAFLLAVRTGVQIIPCRIEGSFDVWKKNSIYMHPGKINLTIFPPIPVEKSQDKQQEKTQIEQLLAKARAIVTSK